MAIGYMGPRRIPMKEIAMALPIRECVYHIVISKLFNLKKSSVQHRKKIGSETYPIAKSA